MGCNTEVIVKRQKQHMIFSQKTSNMLLTSSLRSNRIQNQLRILQESSISTHPWTVSMTSYLRGTVKVTLLRFTLPVSPSFSLQKQTENTLLESSQHKNSLQRELITPHVNLMYLEVGLKNAFWGAGIKVDTVVRNVYVRVGRNLLSLFTQLFASML